MICEREIICEGKNLMNLSPTKKTAATYVDLRVCAAAEHRHREHERGVQAAEGDAAPEGSDRHILNKGTGKKKKRKQKKNEKRKSESSCESHFFGLFPKLK
jgi:hypothetical protein